MDEKTKGQIRGPSGELLKAELDTTLLRAGEKTPEGDVYSAEALRTLNLSLYEDPIKTRPTERRTLTLCWANIADAQGDMFTEEVLIDAATSFVANAGGYLLPDMKPDSMPVGWPVSWHLRRRECPGSGRAVDLASDRGLCPQCLDCAPEEGAGEYPAHVGAAVELRIVFEVLADGLALLDRGYVPACARRCAALGTTGVELVERRAVAAAERDSAARLVVRTASVAGGVS